MRRKFSFNAIYVEDGASDAIYCRLDVCAASARNVLNKPVLLGEVELLSNSTLHQFRNVWLAIGDAQPRHVVRLAAFGLATFPQRQRKAFSLQERTDLVDARNGVSRERDIVGIPSNLRV